MAIIALLVLGLSTVSAANNAESNKIKENLAYIIGVQAYIYGQPIMELYRTFYEGTLDPKRGHERTLNEFIFSRKFVTPEDDRVVTPNNDTLYLRGFLDLTDEPVVLHIPDMGTRNYWFPIGDMYHNLYTHISWDTVGFKGGNFALCAPGWQGVLPDGVKRVEVTTPMIWIMGRYTVYGEKDVPAVNAFQDKTHLIPLSQWGKISAQRVKIDPERYPVFTRYDMTDAMKFFTVMNEMLRRNPPPAKDRALLDWFKEINLHPSQQFDPDTLDPAVRKGLERAAIDALKIIEQHQKTLAQSVNGWTEAIFDSDMSDDPVNHAGVTKMGFLYSQKEVSAYHVGYFDGESKPLDGQNQYVLQFDPVPPVGAFWSVTMYDSKTKRFVQNKINRYAIGDRTPGIRKNEDGSITIYIQYDEPADLKAKTNWLPAPKGPFFMVLREYSPKPAILTREWVPPGVKKMK